MKAVVMERYGAPDDVLKLTDVAKPAPKAGEVLVRVLAEVLLGLLVKNIYRNDVRPGFWGRITISLRSEAQHP